QKLKTQDRLRQWDVGPSIDLNLLKCPLCDLVPDSHDHLFFECSFSSQVWSKVRVLCGMDAIPPHLSDVVAFIIVDFLSSCLINYALTVSPTVYASYIEQFWNTATSKTVNNVKQIHDIVDDKAVVISESSVRNDLLFDDEDGITFLTNAKKFENLALMRYEQLSTKLTFQKGSFSLQ
ncbi:xylulose kinase-1, partial [Tanacetum coccineum]